MKKYRFFSLLLVFLVIKGSAANAQGRNKAPNVIVIFVDDLGYGDLGCYGHPTMETPFIDQMAAEGMRFTQFYVGANVCTPSRAALLTGRLPVRYGLTGGTGVFFPNSDGGLPQSEITIAKALKTKAYQTGLIGKWHLGHLPQYLPAKHGFDYYFGLPYSNDMLPERLRQPAFPPLPLYKDSKIIETNPDQRTLTGRYTDEALGFIKKNKDRPFFLYYANNFPHVPLYVSDKFKGKSKRGLYGDVMLELDWSVGQILKTLKELKLDENTLVFFCSDNGPWLTKKENGGSAGLLFEGKDSAYEGGMRVPAIAWWPGTIKPNQTSTALATTMDVLPTILNLAKVELPKDRVFDGTNLMPLLTGQKEKVRDVVYYYYQSKLFAIRKGSWKAHFATKPSYTRVAPVFHNPPLLYNLDQDPSEKFEIGKQHPEVIEELKKEYEKHVAGVVPVPSQLEATIND